jgi:hypothetical protein
MFLSSIFISRLFSPTGRLEEVLGVSESSRQEVHAAQEDDSDNIETASEHELSDVDDVLPNPRVYESFDDIRRKEARRRAAPKNIRCVEARPKRVEDTLSSSFVYESFQDILQEAREDRSVKAGSESSLLKPGPSASRVGTQSRQQKVEDQKQKTQRDDEARVGSEDSRVEAKAQRDGEARVGSQDLFVQAETQRDEEARVGSEGLCAQVKTQRGRHTRVGGEELSAQSKTQTGVDTTPCAARKVSESEPQALEEPKTSAVQVVRAQMETVEGSTERRGDSCSRSELSPVACVDDIVDGEAGDGEPGPSTRMFPASGGVGADGGSVSECDSQESGIWSGSQSEGSSVDAVVPGDVFQVTNAESEVRASEPAVEQMVILRSTNGWRAQRGSDPCASIFSAADSAEGKACWWSMMNISKKKPASRVAEAQCRSTRRSRRSRKNRIQARVPGWIPSIVMIV